MSNLIRTLTAEAPEEVEELVAQSEKTRSGNSDRPLYMDRSLSDEERKDLEALIDLAQRRLWGPKYERRTT